MVAWALPLIGAALGGIGGALGSKSKKTTTTNTTTEPWSVQKPYLETGFSEAQNALDNALAMGPYQGDLYARMNDTQRQGLAMGTDWASNGGASLQDLYFGNAMDMANTGAQGMTSVAQGLQNWSPTGGVGQNIENAGMYAANPYIDGAIDAASRDVTRNLTESVLPGINRAAVSSGNVNSSRTGVAEGIALRGAQDRIGDIAAGMRMNAYDRGLGMSEAARIADNQQRLNAQTAAGGLYGNVYQGGMSAGQAAQGQAMSNANAFVTAGNAYQQNDQNILNEAYQKYDMQQNQPFDALQRYWNIVGSNNWGQNSTSTSTTKGSSGGGVGGAIQGALGGFTSFAGLGGGFGGGSNFAATGAPYAFGSGGYTGFGPFMPGG